MCVHEEVLAALVFKIIDFGAFPSFGCLTSHFGDFWGLFDLDIEWNVTPLLGHFGGRAGFYFSLQSPPIPPLSFVVGSCTLFSVFMRVNACLQARGLARGTAIRAFTH